MRWATRNVDAPSTFAARPEDPGMFYQWNRKIGWSATDPMINSNGGTVWDSSMATGMTWEKANDPSPVGWRLPTVEEQNKLRDNDKVNRVTTYQNGIYGLKITDKENGNSIFLPAAGWRNGLGGFLDYAGSFGGYCSSTTYTGDDIYNGVHEMF